MDKIKIELMNNNATQRQKIIVEMYDYDAIEAYEYILPDTKEVIHNWYIRGNVIGFDLFSEFEEAYDNGDEVILVKDSYTYMVEDFD